MQGNAPIKNSKHEKFAQLVADGEYANKAYQAIYKCKANSAKPNSERLLTNAIVRARIDWLKQENAKACGLSREEKRLILAKIARKARYDADKIRAIQEDNKMTGDADDGTKDNNFNITIKTP